MKRWQVLLIVAVIALGGAYAYWTFHRNDDRFGDPEVLEQIKSSTDCDKLKRWADGILVADSDNQRKFDQAVGYSNAANDRMKDLDCY